MVFPFGATIDEDELSARMKVAGVVGEATSGEGLFFNEWEEESDSPHKDRYVLQWDLF